MSPKPQQPDAPITKLKEIWRRLPDTARDYWREQLSSSRPLSETRQEIFTKLKIKLGNDGKLSKFREWVAEQDLRDDEAERQQDEERKIFSEHPDWTLDQVREEVLRRSYFRSLTAGDFEFGMQVLAADSKGRFREREVSLAERKAAEARKSEQEKALEFCLEEAKEFPAVQKLFREAFAALKSAKAK